MIESAAAVKAGTGGAGRAGGVFAQAAASKTADADNSLHDSVHLQWSHSTDAAEHLTPFRIEQARPAGDARGRGLGFPNPSVLVETCKKHNARS